MNHLRALKQLQKHLSYPNKIQVWAKPMGMIFHRDVLRSQKENKSRRVSIYVQFFRGRKVLICNLKIHEIGSEAQFPGEWSKSTWAWIFKLTNTFTKAFSTSQTMQCSVAQELGREMLTRHCLGDLSWEQCHLTFLLFGGGRWAKGREDPCWNLLKVNHQ